MDGTIYLDDDVFDGAIDFIKLLIKQNKKYIFLTNNSSKSKLAYIEKLKRLGFPCDVSNIFTSGMAMGIYLKTNYRGKKVYCMGTQNLIDELKLYNVNLVDDNPDIVVVGFDRELTTQKLEKACKFLDDGALFLATNPDWICPIAGGRYVPDCGSMCQMINHATGKTPLFIGKPNPYMIDILSDELKISKDEICVIGDRCYTDIAAGVNAKTYTICVLSGESNMETIEKSDIKPDLILNSIKDLIPLLK